jgi:hypothetical protein
MLLVSSYWHFKGLYLNTLNTVKINSVNNFNNIYLQDKLIYLSHSLYTMSCMQKDRHFLSVTSLYVEFCMFSFRYIQFFLLLHINDYFH